VAQRILQRITLDRERMETTHARERGEEQAEVEKLKGAYRGFKNRLEKRSTESVDGSQSLRRSGYLNGPANGWQFCAAGTSALSAGAERFEATRSHDVK